MANPAVFREARPFFAVFACLSLLLAAAVQRADAQDTTLTVTASGNVGVGVSSPDVRLHVGGRVHIQADDVTGAQRGLVVSGPSGSYGPSLSLDDGLRPWSIVSWNGALQFVTSTDMTFTPFAIHSSSFSNALVVGSNGVGIGTNSPSSRLDVRSGGATRFDLRTTVSDQPVFHRFFYDTDVQGASIGLDPVDNVAKLVYGSNFSSSTNGITVNQNGRVGIGTEDPSGALSIVRSGSPQFDMTTTGSTGSIKHRFLYNGGVEGATVGFRSQGKLLKLINGPNFDASSNGITITQNGDVGIGTTSPTGVLDVRGDGVVRQDLTTTSGTDPVFQRFFYDNNVQGASLGFDTVQDIVKLVHGGGFAGSTKGIAINANGYVGFGVEVASHPIQMASGAVVTAGGVWVNASSRTLKDNIVPLSRARAAAAVEGLRPVTFTYKADPDDPQVGFIAEDVPDLVATADRKGLSALEIVAVLTRVVQAQEERIAALEARLDRVAHDVEVEQ